MEQKESTLQVAISRLNLLLSSGIENRKTIESLKSRCEVFREEREILFVVINDLTKTLASDSVDKKLYNKTIKNLIYLLALADERINMLESGDTKA